MRRRLRRLLVIVLAGVFVVSAGVVGYDLLQYRKGAEVYAEAETLVELPDLSEITPPEPPRQNQKPQEEPSKPQEEPTEPQEEVVYIDPYADALRSMDFTALREVNQEVLGWILIPGTVLSYPVVQHSDNEYYLRRTWRHSTSAVGAIFVEQHNKSDFSDFNTIIYGHNMNNGSMFGTLRKYKSQSYWKSHPNIYVTDDNGSRCYQIFAAYEVSTAGATYQLGFPDEDSRQAFLDFCMEQSLIQTGVTPAVEDQILTLSTCTGRGHATRWVVQAVLKAAVPAEEAPQPDAAEEAGEEALPETSPEAAVPQQEPGSTETGSTETA